MAFFCVLSLLEFYLNAVDSQFLSDLFILTMGAISDAVPGDGLLLRPMSMVLFGSLTTEFRTGRLHA